MRNRPANHFLRDLPSYRYREHELKPEFVQFATTKILPLLAWEGYKVKDKQRLAMHAAHNLILSGLREACVADARGWYKKGAKLRAQVWDALVVAKLARVCLGSEDAGKVTRYRATGKLLGLRKEWELRMLVDTDLVRNTEHPDAPTRLSLIVMHTGKVNPLTGEPLPINDQKQIISVMQYYKRLWGKNGRSHPHGLTPDKWNFSYWEEVEVALEWINRSNLEHSWRAFGIDETGQKRVFQPNPCLRQIHVGKPFNAARLYSWSQLSGQNLSKATRETMQIDGEPVTELDFGGLHTRMLCHLKGIDPEGDVYRPEQVFVEAWDGATKEHRKILRGFVKRVTNICWNVRSRSAANSSTGKLLAEHMDRAYLERVLYDIEGTDPVGIVGRVMAAHPDLQDKFFKEVGQELMTLDGKIMLHILMAFTDEGKPALGIHDSVVCRISDYEFARQTMLDVYWRFMNFEAVVNKVY